MFQCQACGWEAPRQFEYCQECGAGPGAMLSTGVPTLSPGRRGELLEDVPRLAEISASVRHRPTGVALIDGALGGGLVDGQAILVAGAPGSGKTSVTLLTAERFAGDRVLYATSEEALEQVKVRFAGLAVSQIRVVHEADPVRIEELAHRWARALLVVDSLNRLQDPALSAAPGSPSQIKACASILVRWAQTVGVPVVLIGHVTWDDRFQGPRTVEHLVDTVCYYERTESDTVRLLDVQKNRFGPAGRVRIPFDELRPPA